MRFHQEVLALYENDEQAFFEYLDDDNLGDEVKHRINRHGSAYYGILDAGNLIEEINGYAPELIEALPAETRKEYAEFLEDRHGIVAFVYALSEVQVDMIYGEGELFKDGTLITGLNAFIREGQTKQIAGTYAAAQWEEEYDDSTIADDPLTQIAARMPLSVRHKGDTSLYGYNLDSTDTDILEHIEDLQKQLADELLDLEEQLLTEFRNKLRAELEEEYGSRHKRFVAVFSEGMSDTFLRLVLFLNPEAESDDVLMDQVIEEIKTKLAEIPTEDLDTWERMLAAPEDSEEDYKFFELTSELREHIFTKFGGIDFYLLYDVFALYNGFFAEACPILALETPARLSDQLEEHYDGYLDRAALSKYFKYAPELDFEPPESEQVPPARREPNDNEAGDDQTVDGGNYVAWDSETFEAASDQQRWLYFHADWDSNCQALDADINANLADIPEDVVIFKVDYDNSQDLKQRYGVAYQRTVVAVDADAEKTASILANGSNRSLAKIIEALYVEPRP